MVGVTVPGQKGEQGVKFETGSGRAGAGRGCSCGRGFLLIWAWMLSEAGGRDGLLEADGRPEVTGDCRDPAATGLIDTPEGSEGILEEAEEAAEGGLCVLEAGLEVD